MRHYPGPGMGGGSSLLWGFMGFIGTLVVLALLTLLVVFLVKRAKGKKFGPAGMPGAMGHHPHHRPPMPPALQILDERLANGEIEVEDYMTRKAALLGSNGPAANEWTPQPGAPAQPEPPKPDQPADDPSI